MRPMVIALTGAGISKSAGIPTFQDLPGIKEKLSVSYKKKNPGDFETTMRQLTESTLGKEPTEAHKALAKYQVPIVTMNIDGLHTKAGSKLVYEIHGSVKENNVVLYGEKIHFVDKVQGLLADTAVTARNSGVTAYFLVIGTSLQTQFANYLIQQAVENNFYVKRIDSDADIEVPKFLNEIFGTESGGLR